MYTITTTNSRLASNLVHTCVEPEIWCCECGCVLTLENFFGCKQEDLEWAERFVRRYPECSECQNGFEPDDHEPGFDPQD